MSTNFLRSALIMVDVQNDFCPAYTDREGRITPPGVMQIKDGDKVVEPLNFVSKIFSSHGSPVIATQDWHTSDNISFASMHPGQNVNDIMDIVYERRDQEGIGIMEQVLWPDHCVQGTWGAEFHDLLDLNPVSFIVRKGRSKNIDSYSAFFENDRSTATGLGGLLKGLGIESVFIGGLALDYCVFYTAMDAVKLGFKTCVLSDAVQGIGSPKDSIEIAMMQMEDAGIRFMKTGDIQ